MRKARAMEEVLLLFDDLRDRDVTPNVISFSASIFACEKCGQSEHAVLLLDGLREKEWIL